MLKTISIKTSKRNEMIDITDRIQDIINNEKIKSGITIIYNPHTTAAITINEGADPDVCSDIIKTLSKIIPENNDYNHIEGNSDAHIKSSLIGTNEIVIIEDGKLVLGTWQHIFFYEGDGPRQRKIYVKILLD
jgi:secondary thiamine-phosphate synthase enzyme